MAWADPMWARHRADSTTRTGEPLLQGFRLLTNEERRPEYILARPARAYSVQHETDHPCIKNTLGEREMETASYNALHAAQLANE